MIDYDGRDPQILKKTFYDKFLMMKKIMHQRKKFKGSLNMYLQHVLQTIIYYRNIQPKDIYFKNTPATPPGD